METQERIVANLSGKVRRETLWGKTYLVANVTLIVPGILNGSRGPLLYPEEELSRDPSIWNHTPIVLGHPVVNGANVSARSPDVLNQYGMGFVFHSRFEGKLAAEAWFDEEQTRKVSIQTITALDGGNSPIEISTGLGVTNDEKPGEWQGKTYSAIARNHQPDHLAVLIDQKGACSVVDGCGIFNAESKEGLAENYNKAHDRIGRFAPGGGGGGGGGGMPAAGPPVAGGKVKAAKAPKEPKEPKAPKAPKAAKPPKAPKVDKEKAAAKEKATKEKAAAKEAKEKAVKEKAEAKAKAAKEKAEAKEKAAKEKAEKAEKAKAAKEEKNKDEHADKLIHLGKDGNQMVGFNVHGANLGSASITADVLKGAKLSGKLTPHEVARVLDDRKVTGVTIKKGESYFGVNNPKALKAIIKAAKSGKYKGKKIKNSTDLDNVAKMILGVHNTQNSSTGESTMTRQENIEWLTTNCACMKTAAGAKALNAMTDEEVDELREAEKAEADILAGMEDADEEADEEAGAEDAESEESTEETAVTTTAATKNQSRLTAEEQEDIAFARAEKNRQKGILIRRLVANVAEDQRDARAKKLMAKPLDELRELAELIPETATNQDVQLPPSYFGAGGGPVRNVKDDSQNLLPDVWAEMADKAKAS